MTDQAKPAGPADGAQTDLEARFRGLTERSDRRLFGDTANELARVRKSRQGIEAAKKSDDEDDADSEATIDFQDPSTTTSFWSNPLLRAAQLNSMALRCKGAVSYVRSKWGYPSGSTQPKTHTREEEKIRASNNVTAAQSTNGNAGVITTHRAKESLRRAQDQDGSPGEAAVTDTGTESAGAAAPEKVRTVPPTEAQVETSISHDPGDSFQAGRHEHDAPSGAPALPETLHSHHEAALQAHAPPSRGVTEATAEQLSTTGEGTEAALDLDLQLVERLSTIREQRLAKRHTKLASRLSRKATSLRKGVPRRDDEMLKATGKYYDEVSKLSEQDGETAHEIYELTMAHNQLRAADRTYIDLFGSKWREPGGNKAVSSEAAQAILDDTRLDGPIDLSSWIPEIATYFCRPELPRNWKNNFSSFIEARQLRQAARETVRTMLSKQGTPTVDSKPESTAAAITTDGTAGALPESLAPWRPSMYSANRLMYGQFRKILPLRHRLKTTLDLSRASGQLLTTLQALETGPDYIFKNAANALKLYERPMDRLKQVLENHGVTSLDEGLPEESRKQASVWIRNIRKASRHFYDEAATEQREQAADRLEEHLKSRPLQLSVTQLSTKVGGEADKAAYTWNEDEDVVTEQLAQSAIEWNFERAGPFTFELHDQDDFSRAHLRDLLPELTKFEENVNDLGRIRARREERAQKLVNNSSASDPIDKTGLPKPSTQTQEATQEKGRQEQPTTATSTDATAPAPQTTARTGWEPNNVEHSFLNPVKDAKHRIGEALDEVKQLDREFASRLAPLRTKLEGYEALQSEPLITQTKSQILSLLDTWSTYSKYDRSRPHLQEFNDTDHEAWTDFFSRNKIAFKDRCALTAEFSGFSQGGSKALAILSMHEVAKATSVPFDEVADAYTREERTMAKRLKGGRPVTFEEQVLWTSWESKRLRRKKAETVSQANQTTKEDKVNEVTEKTDTSQVNPEPSDVTESKTSEKPLTTSIAEASDVSDHAVPETTLTSAA